jgi:formate hydrogenlyase subunit 3/multisubunit Na+/H+ antiporter MnhD subunit
VLLARHALLFLVAWEAMTLLAFLLVTFDDAVAEVRRAGWAYLVASHVAVVALLALFLVLSGSAGGALDFDALDAAWQTSSAGVAGVLALAVVGFGVKAGVAGLHVWLPEAHAAAPSHVSALMSSVLIKLGIYRILRITLLVEPVPGLAQR